MKKKRTLSLNSSAWKQLRAEVLASEPLCRMCTARGLVVPATDVDHIEDSREDYTDDNSRENLQSLCHTCHSLKTAASMNKSVFLGCDVSGMPLDPAHPWNKETPEKIPDLLEKSPATAEGKTALPLPVYC